MREWSRTNWKKLTILAAGAGIVYLSLVPWADRPEAQAAGYFLRGFAALLGLGL